ncbi:MAG TPA: hypothetical protein V6D37_01755 [Candidatus Sericytochromatia bacterium]
MHRSPVVKAQPKAKPRPNQNVQDPDEPKAAKYVSNSLILGRV